MTNKTYVASLSEDGWVDDSIKIADYIFSYFFLSDYSQTYLYINRVSSLPWILQSTQGSMEKTTDLTRSTLTNLFSAYFNNVEVETSANTSVEKPSEVTLNIYVSFTDSEGKTYRLGKLLDIANLTISKIISENNGV